MSKRPGFEIPQDAVDLLRWADVILANTSAGKDSQAMLDVVAEMVDAAGVRDRVLAVHCDLGRVEWPGTVDLAGEQAAHYSFPFETVKRDGTVTRDGRVLGDLLDQIEKRGMFPDASNRYCTSDQKTSQVKKLMTRLVDERRNKGGYVRNPDGTYEKRRVRILNLLGIRAEESPARAAKTPLDYDPANWTRVKRDGETVDVQHGKREVVRWYPIFDWTVEQVWERNAAAGTRHHEAYDLGMPRLSCCFCVLAPKSALVLAARANPELAREYERVEVKIGHRFKKNLSMGEIIEAAEAEGEVVAEDWAA